MKTFTLTINGNTLYHLEDATRDGNGLVSGMCVAHRITSRIGPYSSTRIGEAQGKHRTLGEVISDAEWERGSADRCYC